MSTEVLDWGVVRFSVVESTMDEAALLARNGAPTGTVVLADHQTKGRGQRGRTWFEPPGTCLLATIVLRPALRVATSPEMSRMIAEKVASAIGEIAGLVPAVKEPNDLLIDGHKVCGILCQSSIRGDNLEYLLVGIGLNVNIPPEELPLATATSLLAETGVVHDRELLLSAILRQVRAIPGLCDGVPVRAGV